MNDFDTRLHMRNLRTMASAQHTWDDMAEPESDDPDGDPCACHGGPTDDGDGYCIACLRQIETEAA